MNVIHYIANVVILLGAAALIAGVIYKLFFLMWLGLQPGSFLKFANVCLLLGIALYVRELIAKKKEAQ
jgi:hypothetical protein